MCLDKLPGPEKCLRAFFEARKMHLAMFRCFVEFCTNSRKTQRKWSTVFNLKRTIKISQIKSKSRRKKHQKGPQSPGTSLVHFWRPEKRI